MNDSKIIRPQVPDVERMGDDPNGQEELWRRAEDDSIPLAEKVAFAVGAIVVAVGYFSGILDQTDMWFLLFLGLVATSGARFRRMQSQIDALRELLRRATGKP